MHTVKSIIVIFTILYGLSVGTTVYEYIQNQSDLGFLTTTFETEGSFPPLLKDLSYNFTVFAPVDDGIISAPEIAFFDFSLRTLLGYHILPGLLRQSDFENDLVVDTSLASNSSNDYFLRFNNYDGVWYLNGKRYEAARGLWASVEPNGSDVETENGIVHVITELLFPTGQDEQKTIEQEVEDNPLFSQLNDAFAQANFSGVNLSAYTLFAPTDEAFAKFPPGVINIIFGEPNNLNQFLLYHILPSTYFSVGLKNGLYPTLAGKSVAIFRLTAQKKRQGPTDSTTNSSLLVNGVLAQPTDIHRRNGVIHVINNALFPPDLCLAPKTDGGKTLADPKFWCHQLRSALSRNSRWRRYSRDDLLELVYWISNTSSYFSGMTNLTVARNILCSNSLDSLTLGLWFDVASGNVFLESNVADFCDPSRIQSWYKRKSYTFHCTKFSYKKKFVNPSNDTGSINDALAGAEAALLSGNRTLRTQYTNYLRGIFSRQAPGASGCPNTCGASAFAARAISETSADYIEITGGKTGLSAGIAAVISSIVTAFAVILIVGVVMHVMRERVVELLAPSQFK